MRHRSSLSPWWLSSPTETNSSSGLALARNVCLWVWLSLVDCAPKSATHFSSLSKFNSLLFQFNFHITGNFPLKEISIYGHLLLMCFLSLFLLPFYVFKMKWGQSLPFLLEQLYSPFLKDKERGIHFTILERVFFIFIFMSF